MSWSSAVNATGLPEVLASVSGYSPEPEPETVGSNDIWHAVVILAYSSLIVVSVAGNGIVILSVVTCRRMRTVTNYFIVSLASADLVMAVLCIPPTFIANWLVDRWPFGAVMCPVVTYLQTVSVFLSAFTLVGLVAKNDLISTSFTARRALYGLVAKNWLHITLVGLVAKYYLVSSSFTARLRPLRPHGQELASLHPGWPEC